MRERRVIIPLSVRLYMDEIADHIIELSRPEHAVRYIHEMVAEINELSYMADMLQSHIPPISRSTTPMPSVTTSNTAHGVLSSIVEGEYVIVDKILPSSLITY